MAKLSIKFVFGFHGKQTGGPLGFSFFVAWTEVNSYLVIKYFHNIDEAFMSFRKNG